MGLWFEAVRNARKFNIPGEYIVQSDMNSLHLASRSKLPTALYCVSSMTLVLKKPYFGSCLDFPFSFDLKVTQ